MPQNASRRDESSRFDRFTRRTLTAIGIAAAIGVLLLFFEAVASVLLLIFAGVLLAVLLHGLAKRVSQHTPLSHGWSLALVMLLLVGILGGGGWYLAPEIATQIDQLTETLPQSIESLRETLAQYRWGQALLGEVPTPQEAVGSVQDVWGRITGVFSTIVGILATTIFILAVGIYVAANPELYKRGIVLLVPIDKRDRAREVLDEMGRALWGWLVGQLISMTIIGVLVWLGLMLLGIPLALALGLIAGLFEFVPLIGPWVGALPGILIAFTEGTSQMLYVALLYLGVQQLESNVVTPIVMKKAVSLPPAVTISATVLAGVLFGLKGVLLATPLAVVAMVLIRALYIHDFLEDRSVTPVR